MRSTTPLARLRAPISQASHNPKRKLPWVAAAVLLVLVAARHAEALNLTPSSAAVMTTHNSAINTPEDWFTYFGIADPPDLMYKSDVSGTTGLGVDKGPFASSYQTTFSNTADKPGDALIEYLGGGSITACGVCYLVVKGGNTDPAQYLFKLTSWNGTESITLSGFWQGNGNISNVAIYGVPEPSTVYLFGAGLICAVAVRRRKRLVA